MKYSPLLPQVALVFAVAYACTDSTAPANSHASLTPRNPTLDALGDPPPPPVDAAIGVCTNAGCAAYDGTYFSNGSSLESQLAAALVADQDIFNGTAWLKFDNTPGTASANARFKRQDDKKTFSGSLTINTQLITIVTVDEFFVEDDCGTPTDPCAEIVFSYRIGTDPNSTVFHNGTADAFHFGGENCGFSFGEGTFYFCED